MKLIIAIGMIGKWLKEDKERTLMLDGRFDDNGKRVIQLQATEELEQGTGVFHASGTIVSVLKQFAEWIKNNKEWMEIG